MKAAMLKKAVKKAAMKGKHMMPGGKMMHDSMMDKDGDKDGMGGKGYGKSSKSC